MNWANLVLRFLVRRRDRETISGDLLEEYREAVQPTSGALAAHLWYARQVLSFVHPRAWGLLIGVSAGTLQLLGTALHPLAEDTPAGMLIIAGTLMLLWLLTSVAAVRRTHRFGDAIVSGVVVGMTTMTVIYVSSLVRVNVFLEQIRDREDWVNLVSRFHASGFESLRAYANYEYLPSLPILLAIGALIGGGCGAVGGAIDRVIRPPLAPSSSEKGSLTIGR